MIRNLSRIMAYVLALTLLGCAGSPPAQDSEASPPQITEEASPNQPPQTAGNPDEVSPSSPADREKPDSEGAPVETEIPESDDMPVPKESPVVIDGPKVTESPGTDDSSTGAQIPEHNATTNDAETPDLETKTADSEPPGLMRSPEDDVIAVEPTSPVEQSQNDDTEEAVTVKDQIMSSDNPLTSPANPLLTEDRPFPVEVPTKPLSAKPTEPVNDADLKSSSQTAPRVEEPIVRIPTDDIPDSGNVPEPPPYVPPPVQSPERTDQDEGVSAASAVPPLSIEEMEKAAAAPSRQLDGPGEFSVVLDGQGWVFRSDLSTPGAWRFLAREREGESTRFRFLFDETGRWTMVFERQDLSSGGSERAIRSVVVGDDGGSTVSLGPPVQGENSAIPGTLPMSPDERNLAAESAIDKGRVEEALQLWDVDAPRNDAAGRRARSAIITQASRAGAIGPLVTWLPKYLADNPDPDVLAESLRAFEGEAGYERQTVSILESLVRSDDEKNRAEWLYRLANQLEQPGDFRNLDRAATLYGEVIDQWPLTTWRNLSEERLNWLKRYYFRVR